jgi:hypothetical protein
MGSTDRPLDAAPRHQAPVHHPAGNDPLARALSRARWTIFWERLWPALASIATVIGLFLAVSWLGLHQDLSKTKGKCNVNGKTEAVEYDPKDEIEKGISAVRWAVGASPSRSDSR